MDKASIMEERGAVVRYLRGMADTDPPPEILARNPEWTPTVLRLAKAMLLSSARQIEEGLHLDF